MVKEEEARLKFIQVGSQLKLNCYLRKATEPPAYIFWFHNKTMVNYSPELGRQVINHQDGMGSTLMVREFFFFIYFAGKFCWYICLQRQSFFYFQLFFRLCQ